MNKPITKSELGDACTLTKLFLAGRTKDVAEYLAPFSPEDLRDLFLAQLVVTTAMTERPPGLSVGRLLDLLPNEGA